MTGARGYDSKLWYVTLRVRGLLNSDPKGQRSLEFPPGHTLRNLINLLLDSLSTFAYGIGRPVASRFGFVLEGFLCNHEHSRF